MRYKERVSGIQYFSTLTNTKNMVRKVEDLFSNAEHGDFQSDQHNLTNVSKLTETVNPISK